MTAAKSYNCPKCGGFIVTHHSPRNQSVLIVLVCPHCGSTVAIESEPKGVLVALGYVFPLIALVFFPPAFGIAGLVCGITNVNRGREGHGLAQIILSIVCGGIGMLAGYYQGGFR